MGRKGRLYALDLDWLERHKTELQELFSIKNEMVNQTHIFKCPLCHLDYTDEPYTTTDVNLYFKHLRDIHKTTDFNLDRFLYLGYQLKGMNEKHIKLIYRLIKISLSLNHVKKDYYLSKIVTLKEIQEAVKRIMMD